VQTGASSSSIPLVLEDPTWSSIGGGRLGSEVLAQAGPDDDDGCCCGWEAMFLTQVASRYYVALSIVLTTRILYAICIASNSVKIFFKKILVV
jgi:hypothetical protein